eukprot:SAG31_NODE_16431_length_709_cov_1.686885_1_plen_23_part_10
MRGEDGGAPRRAAELLCVCPISA